MKKQLVKKNGLDTEPRQGNAETNGDKGMKQIRKTTDKTVLIFGCLYVLTLILILLVFIESMGV